MPKLTIIAPNKNRLDINSPASQWFLRSLTWQTNKDFELLVLDGGSNNIDNVKELLSYQNINLTLIQHKIGDEFFHKTLLNNVAIRKAKTEYIMTTDVDILFGKDFVETLFQFLALNVFIDSRVLSWKSSAVQRVYNGELDPYNNLEACKIGKIKGEATCGACQATHKDNWYKVHGYNELFKGWGSEDTDLLVRMRMAGVKIKWMGTTRESIMAFHQPHPKKDLKNDLEWQEKNKKFLYNIKDYKANPNGWGGIYE